MKKRTISRRAFLAGSAAAAAGPLILPQGVLAAAGRPGANDRVVLGVIGTGGMGRHHLSRLRDHVAVICDVDDDQLAKGAAIVGPGVDTCKDFRTILDRRDIDAVLIAAPDHWHGVMTVMACQAGKDVYVEKPSSVTIEEGQAMLRAARRFGRVVQVGSQGRSQPGAHLACTYFRNGGLGAVNRVECWHYENPVGGDPRNDGPPPSNLDWDMWLGPARWVPYNPDRVHFNFRWFLEFGGGQIRDRGAHVLSLTSWFLDIDKKGPVRVRATGEPPHEGIWDCPTTMEAVWEFEDPELTIVWAQPGNKPEGEEAQFGAVYHGSNGSLTVRGGDGSGTGAEITDFDPDAAPIQVFRSPGHHENWLECIRTRNRPIMDIEAAHAVAVLCIIGNIAYRVGRPLEWDHANQRFVNDDQANLYLGNPGRGPWHI